MSRTCSIALIAVAAAAVSVWSLWSFHTDGSAAGPATQPFIRRAPYIARDGTSGPPPTPPPASQLDVVVRVEMEVQELSLTLTGTTPVTIKAEARTKFPGFFGPPEDTLADVVATAHPNDLAGCTWQTVYTKPKAKVTISDSQGVFTRGVHIKIDDVKADASGWHFDITCPTDPPSHFRVPAYGEESVGGWLTLTHLGTPDGVVIQTPDYSGSPSCIKRKGSVQGTDPVFGTAKVTVYAVEPGCIVPP